MWVWQWVAVGVCVVSDEIGRQGGQVKGGGGGHSTLPRRLGHVIDAIERGIQI